MSSKGKIIIPANADIWPHELSAAQALSAAGYTVEFLPRIQGHKVKTPDILLNSSPWEIKCPQTDQITAIERNIRRACKQSNRVVLDSRRMRKLKGKTIIKECQSCTQRIKSLQRLLLIIHPDNVLAIK